MKPTFQEIGTRTGALVEDKNRAYGSSFATAGAMLQLLYPNGIEPTRMHDALLLARIWDKMMRIATDREALGENPYQDIVGYGILGVHMHHHDSPDNQAKGDQGPCNSTASTAPDSSLANASPSSASSAATDANATPTPPASEKSESAPTPRSAACSTNTSAPTDALAATAQATASSRAAALRAARERNERGLCATDQCRFHLPRPVGYVLSNTGDDGDPLEFCASTCRFFYALDLILTTVKP